MSQLTRIGWNPHVCLEVGAAPSGPAGPTRHHHGVVLSGASNQPRTRGPARHCHEVPPAR
jgi:hypothetical protein